MTSVSTSLVGLTLCGAPVHDVRASKVCGVTFPKAWTPCTAPETALETEPATAPQLNRQRECGTGPGAPAPVESRGQTTGQHRRSAL